MTRRTNPCVSRRGTGGRQRVGQQRAFLGAIAGSDQAMPVGEEVSGCRLKL